jgi:Methionine biosynthesis protein MetW
MSQVEEFDSAYAQSQIERSRHPIRRIIKSFYVKQVLRWVQGPAIDVGCGAGQILERLPKGSMGIELNPHLVAHLQSKGLKVERASLSDDRLDLSPVPRDTYKTLVLSHVLEHFSDAHQVLRLLLKDCWEKGIETVIMVLPCEVGYESDPTHKTFVTMAYLEQNNLLTYSGFSVVHHSYFPLNIKSVGQYFIYNELQVVYRRTANSN